MAATILDGVAESKRLLEQVKNGVERLARDGKKPVLAAIQANNDPGTDWYARAQAKHCAQNGIELRHIRLPATISEDELTGEIAKTSADPDVSGIILFTPLPLGVNHMRLVEALDPRKDAEGVHPSNMGRLLVASSVDPAPCTAMAALELILTARPDLAGARALVIGRSATVGKPLGLLLLARHATVTIAHTRSDLRAAMLESEVVVAAAGASGARWRAYEKKWLAWKNGKGDRPAPPQLEPLVTMDMIRRGAIIIDVGDNNIPVGLDKEGAPLVNDKNQPDMKYAGDVDYDKVREVAGYITKPRGSVGPVTNAWLLRNVTRSALLLAGMDTDLS